VRKVGVKGGSGFIETFNTKIFLEDGYAVSVSATDISKN